MRFLLLPLLLLTLLTPKPVTAQDNKKEQIAKALNDYFHLERENIHVHFDKNVFLTDEKIWFKGYVFHRKTNTPFFATTNIYASLIDTEGNIIKTQLLYGNLASFSGSFDLGNNLKSGKYFLQFYTNWMNNFTEDESAVYEVDIINPAQGIASNLGKPDLSKINITFHPEGGTFLKDCPNSIGISVTDCNGKPVQASSVNIVDANGETLKTLQLNKFGFGRFDLTAGNTAGLKAEVTVNNTKHLQALPPAQLTGVALEINNYAIPDKLIAKIKTNKITADSFGSQPLYMVIHQDEKVLIHTFSFVNSKLEQDIVILQKDLFDGTNTIRILDPGLNQIAERMIFKYPKAGLTTALSPAVKSAESTEIKGTLNYPTMNVSVSVLPEGTASLVQNSDIYGSFLIAPHIEDKSVAAKYYLEAYSKIKHYELDLFLVNQAGKYKWKDIMKSPPKSSYPFDMGVSLKATVNQNLRNKKDYKVRVVSIAGMIDEQVDINEKGEIQLNNLILADSSTVKFSLLEKGVKKQELKLYPQIFNNVRKFNKPYKPQPALCTTAADWSSLSEEFTLPQLPENTIILEEAVIIARKSELKYKNAPGNSQLKGYKIGDHESNGFFYILDYIRSHGFSVENDGVNVNIFGMTVNTINGQRTMPMVYIDNMMVMDFSILLNVQTADVDEIYINRHAVVPSVDNKMGIIRIFMKKYFPHRDKSIADTSFMVNNGFKTIEPFENISYTSTSDKGFENIGLIDWEPVILPDGNGEFTLNIPHTSQKTVKLLIEGFSADGRLVSEIKTITLK